MNESPRPEDQPPIEDPPPASDPEPDPDFPKPLQVKRKPRPETLADNVEVTPLDEDEHIKQGIDVEER